MGQKVNPIGMRLQVNRTWDSRWFAESKDYATCCWRTCGCASSSTRKPSRPASAA